MHARELMLHDAGPCRGGGASRVLCARGDARETLLSLTNDLQAEAERLHVSPAKLALTALTARLDVLIDQVIDEGVTEDPSGPAPDG